MKEKGKKQTHQNKYNKSINVKVKLITLCIISSCDKCQRFSKDKYNNNTLHYECHVWIIYVLSLFAYNSNVLTSLFCKNGIYFFINNKFDKCQRFSKKKYTNFCFSLN